MSNNNNKNVLTFIAVIAGLLLVSLIGNVVLLSLLNRSHRQLATVKQELTDLRYEFAEYKTGTAEAELPDSETDEPEAPDDSPAPDMPDETPAPGAQPGTEPEPTAEPTAEPTPEPTPASPYAASKLDYEPQDTELLGETRTGTVVCTVDVNVRSGPGTNYNKLASVSSGNELKVYASAYGWFLIEYKKNIYGWISGQYFFGGWMFETGLNSFLKDIDPAKEYLTAPEKIAVTHPSGANGRSGPGSANDIIARLNTGDECIWIATNGEWRFCDFQGTYCWIHNSNFK